jgi:HK97 family phage prohead protease
MSRSSPEHENADIQASKSIFHDREYKSFDWEIKSLDDSGKLSMYVASFNNIDRGNDVIEPGAFANVDQFIKWGWLGTNHDMKSLPIGYPLSAVQDSKGLLCDFQFHSTPEAQAARTTILERMRANKAVSGSIGYKIRPGGSKPDRLDGKSIRRLSKLDIFEASYVNLPMNPEASVISAKSADHDHDREREQDQGDGPKLIGLDDFKSFLEEYDKKAGKVISRANLNTLKDTHAKLGDVHATLGAFIDQHDPDGGIDEPDDDALVGGGGRVAGKDARLETLRLRAVRGRVTLASLPRE